jgi:hypothetical protein
LAEAQTGNVTILDKPIQFDSARLALTEDYSLRHYGWLATSIVPRIIVIHHTSSNCFTSAYNEFYGPQLKGRDNLALHGRLNVSAHFIVDRDGTIYRMMPETLMGRHTIGLNHCAVGIENVGEENLTSEQLDADEQLVRYLVRKYPTIEYLIGHRESGAFRGSAIYAEKEQGYYVQAGDPSLAFLSLLRARLSDLALSGLPR